MSHFFNRLPLCAAALLLIMATAVPLSRGQAQTRTVIAGAGPVFDLPIGTLHDRFRGAFGGMAYAGGEVSPQWTWIGKLEYVELGSLNTDALHKIVTLGQGSAKQQYSVPLPKLTMKLTATSLTAEAMLSLFRSGGLQSHAVLGFGFTHWVNTRGQYYDSLFVDSAAIGHFVKAQDLAVPSNRQEDWSGTLNLGFDVAVKMADPVWLVAGVDYKIILGELWQTLDLDLENVSGLQFVTLRAGVRAEF